MLDDHDTFPEVECVFSFPDQFAADDVVCSFCGCVYNLLKVTSMARYHDRDVYVTPCCDKEATLGIFGNSFMKVKDYMERHSAYGMYVQLMRVETY